MAQGLANRANAQAAESAERARAQAIQNQIHLAELRRRQRAIRAEREEEKRIAQAVRFFALKDQRPKSRPFSLSHSGSCERPFDCLIFSIIDCLRSGVSGLP